MELEAHFPNCDSSSSDLDLSFTSCASNTSTDRTFTSSSARSSLTLSTTFNDQTLLSSTSSSLPHRPHRKSDPHWSSISAATALSPDGNLQLQNLQLLRHLGSGNLGHVYLCRLKDLEHDDSHFALKVVDKDALTHRKLSHVQMEAEILSVVDHPYLPTLYAHLEASHYSCLLIDYCSNGDLHALLRRQPHHRFSISAVRFFASEVLIALEYLHALGFIYRDLKPENVLIREDGHIMLSDFDLCFKADVSPTVKNIAIPTKRTKAGAGTSFFSCFGSGSTEDVKLLTEFVAEPVGASSRSCVGTHEYLAPELVNGNGHGNGVDWWAFGVFIYELMYGKTPFKGETKETTLRNIASGRQVVFPMTHSDIEEDGAREAKDLITKLLRRDTTTRLGCSRGATEIKGHPFFKGIKWPLIRTYKVPEVRGLERRTTKNSTSKSTSPRKKMVRACKSMGGGRSWSVKYVAGVMRRAVSFSQ